MLHVLQQKRDVDILASPSTLVVSGQSATIQAVEEIPYKELIDSATGGQEALSTTQFKDCLLYTSDAADDLLCVDLGGRRIIKKKKYQAPEYKRTRSNNHNDHYDMTSIAPT